MTEFNVAGEPSRPSQPNLPVLRPTFLKSLNGELTAAELPQLGLLRVNRLKGEPEPAFRQRVHLELVKMHFEWSGPFYELLDTPTLKACKNAIETVLTTHESDPVTTTHDSGEFYFRQD